LLGAYSLYAAALLVAFLPTLVTRQVLYGSPFRFGIYATLPWHWGAPALWRVLVSSNHGLLSWTPILIPALAGLLLFRRRDPVLGGLLLAAAAAFSYIIASYPYWDGVLSFGNRFFISLTPLFVLGLAAAFAASERIWGSPRAALARVVPATLALVLWNLGFLYQWQTHLVPQRGPVSWQEVLYNQFRVVPEEILGRRNGRTNNAPPPSFTPSQAEQQAGAATPAHGAHTSY
jgi:hypothetical protein